MAIVVPEGLIFNKAYAKLRQYLFQNSRVLLIAHLPGGCFLPYTAAKSAIIYLVDKGLSKTEWFYRAKVKNDGYSLDAARSRLYGSNDLDELLYFFEKSSEPSKILPINTELKIVYVENLES
ncbi:MAG: hypothetical protein OXD35_01005, partial [Thiotrichales bacterium]|nr:hypothetical protein [Thiotrichales bacterium]